MKNFDTGRVARQVSEDERTFQMGGETFVIRAGVRPDVLVGYDDLGDDTTTERTLEVLDDLIQTLLEPNGGSTNGKSAQERYLALRAREDDPLELTDLLDIVNWCVEVYTARPTGKPSVSDSGRSETGTQSTAASSSPDIPTALPV